MIWFGAVKYDLGRHFDGSRRRTTNPATSKPARPARFSVECALADALPLLRAVVETRKDQIAAQNFTVRPRARADVPDPSARIDKTVELLARPERRRADLCQKNI